MYVSFGVLSYCFKHFIELWPLITSYKAVSCSAFYFYFLSFVVVIVYVPSRLLLKIMVIVLPRCNIFFIAIIHSAIVLCTKQENTCCILNSWTLKYDNLDDKCALVKK